MGDRVQAFLPAEVTQRKRAISPGLGGRNATTRWATTDKNVCPTKGRHSTGSGWERPVRSRRILSPMPDEVPLPPPPSFAPPQFLPVQELLALSEPEPRVAWVGWASGLLLLIVLGSALLTSKIDQGRGAVQILSGLAM